MVGGGYIGMECAAGLASTGLAGRVTMVFPEDRLMGRLLTPQLAGAYERLYGDKGVAMVKGAKVTGFAGEGGKVRKGRGERLCVGLGPTWGCREVPRGVQGGAKGGAYGHVVVVELRLRCTREKHGGVACGPGWQQWAAADPHAVLKQLNPW